MSGARIREAGPDDTVAVMRVIEGALLDVDAAEVRQRAADGDVLVADDGGSVIGAIVLEPADGTAHIDALAVARRHREQAVGTALVEAAADRHGTLTADFRPEVEGFWTGLGFEVLKRGDRLRGRRG